MSSSISEDNTQLEPVRLARKEQRDYISIGAVNDDSSSFMYEAIRSVSAEQRRVRGLSPTADSILSSQNADP